MKPQRIFQLTPEDLTAQRKRVAEIQTLLQSRYGAVQLTGRQPDLDLLQRLLDDRVLHKTELVQLQSLGLVLGNVLVEELGFRWVMVEDEYGRDPALQLWGTSMVAFPLTMISKRVERGEAMDLRRLFNSIRDDAKERRPNA